MVDTSNGPNVKGVAFRSVMAAVSEILGQPEMDRVLADMNPELRETIQYRIVATGWYPIQHYKALWEAILQRNPQDSGLVRRIGAASIKRDVTGVYRLVFKVISPQTVVSVSGRMFNHYYDTGRHDVVDARSGHARAVYQGCIGFNQTMWLELLGASTELLTMAGAKNVRMVILKSDDEGNCEMTADWQ